MYENDISEEEFHELCTKGVGVEMECIEWSEKLSEEFKEAIDKLKPLLCHFIDDVEVLFRENTCITPEDVKKILRRALVTAYLTGLLSPTNRTRVPSIFEEAID